MNIHGCQLHTKVAIYVVKQLKNDSFCQGLYVINTYIHVSLQIQNYDNNRGLGDFVDPDSLISIEVTYVDRSVIDQSSADQSLIVSIQFNSLDIIANQETIIELIYFARRIMPDSLKAAAVAAAASSNQRRRKMPTKVVTE